MGSLMSGVMFGIMVSRPIAGFLLDFISWHAVYYFSAAAMTLVGAILAFTLPARQPAAGDLRYRELLVTMVKLPVHYSTLRRRSIYQGSIFFAFCLFWTTVPILLAGPNFSMSQSGIAQFALVGVTGAVFAPIFGRLADRGFTNQATTFSFLAGAGSFFLTRFVPMGSSASLVLLTLAAILLDAAVSGNLVVGQRAIFTLPADLRGRLNSLYVTTIFTGGALGSFVGAWVYSRGGWNLTSMIGGTMPTLGLIYFVTEFFRKPIVSDKDLSEKRSI
jgi:predicted MFS family arabinose efflux permease